MGLEGKEDWKDGREAVANDQRISIGIGYRAGFTIGLSLRRSDMSVGKR